jgi:hypothetical protein
MITAFETDKEGGRPAFAVFAFPFRLGELDL